MIEWLVPQASTYAAEIDNLITLITVLVGFWFFVAQGALFYLIFKFKEKAGRKALYITGEKKEEKKWITRPHNIILACDIVIIVMAIKVWVAVKQTMPEPDAKVNVISQQWAWTFVHPGPDGKLDTDDDIPRSTSCTSKSTRPTTSTLSLARRAAQLQRAGVPPQAGRGAGPHHPGLVQAHQDRQLRHPVRRDLRRRARPDAGSHRHRVTRGARRLDRRAITEEARQRESPT